MKRKKFENLNWRKRLEIEALCKAGIKPLDIAKQLNVHHTTIYRELKRGKTQLLNSDLTYSTVYCADVAQSKAEKNQKEKGRPLKVNNDLKFMQYVENKILKDKYSPAAVLAEIKQSNMAFDTEICLSTLYNYIKGELFLNITMVDTPYKHRQNKKKRRVQKRVNAGTSIEERPEYIEDREEFGHWEMDTVVGKRGDSQKSLLVLTERKTRLEVIRVIKSHTAQEVVKALDKIERKLTEKKFRNIFKSITVDNGSEFSDVDGIERSRRNQKKRTKVFYCHSYSSWERGSNENANKLIRRWLPKGSSFENLTNAIVERIQRWINNYPRLLFGFKTSLDLASLEVCVADLL